MAYSAFNHFRRKFDAWRSSKAFILSTLTFAIFVDTFLPCFAVPILPYIFQVRIGVEGPDVQSSIAAALSFFGLSMFLLSPVTGIFIDKFPNRKWPLILGLVAQIASTCLTALSTSVFAFCFSRVFQGAAGSLVWVTSLATIADAVGSLNMGKTMGVIGPLISSGGIFGPMVGGLLLSSVGFWYSWLVPIAMLTLDLILRLAMIDKPRQPQTTPIADTVSSNGDKSNHKPDGADQNEHLESTNSTSSNTTDLNVETPCTEPSSSISSSAADDSPNFPFAAQETSPLLSPHSKNICAPSHKKPLSHARYFYYVLSQKRIFASSLITVLTCIIFNSFNATLALHVEEVFDWGPREVGFLFLALVGPSVILGPFAGWLRDKIGVRWPTMAGTASATPLFILIGLAGDKRLHWTQGDLGKGILIGSLILMGVSMELTAGLCVIEGALVIDELEARNPGIFGKQGGYSRFFSITGMLFPLGSLIGPLLAGGLTVKVGYSMMNNVMAIISIVCCVISALFIGPRK